MAPIGSYRGCDLAAGPTPGTATPSAPAASTSSGPITLSPDTASIVFVIGHGVSGFCGLVSALLDSFEASEDDGDNDWGIPSAVVGILGGVTDGIANVLVPRDPIENTGVVWVNRMTLGVRILCKIIFSGPAQEKFAASTKFKSLSVVDGRGVGAVVDAVLAFPALICTCWHFYELSQDPAGHTRSVAIVEETSNMTSYIARVSYAVAVNLKPEDDPDPDSAAALEAAKKTAIVVMAVSDVCYGGLQIAEAVMGPGK